MSLSQRVKGKSSDGNMRKNRLTNSNKMKEETIELTAGYYSLTGTISMNKQRQKGSVYYLHSGNQADGGENSDKPEPSSDQKETQDEKKKVLIVEDDRVSVFYLRELINMIDIEGVSIQTEHVTTGEKAIDHCRDHSCDLILMDIKLPGISGLDATRKIKKLRPFLPVIAQTAFALSGDEDKALDAGCDDYLSKPISEEALMEKLRKYLWPS